MIELELPFPPSVNHYYRRVGPRTLISREGRAFREKVCSALASLGVRPASGPLEVHVEVFPPDRRRRDVDNVQKALLDALEHGGAYRNDSQIVKLVAEKREPVRGGRTIVRIKEAKPC
jgi:Holliday junction resolvase RusA-like endonuclease